jgi:hypothetical protein
MVNLLKDYLEVNPTKSEHRFKVEVCKISGNVEASEH